MQVNAIGGVDHVIGMRGEEDQGRDGNLYNYLVITVGTPDGARSADVRVRMDHLDAGIAAAHQAWAQLNALQPVEGN